MPDVYLKTTTQRKDILETLNTLNTSINLVRSNQATKKPDILITQLHDSTQPAIYENAEMDSKIHSK